jgi:hypothetical protein
MNRDRCGCDIAGLCRLEHGLGSSLPGRLRFQLSGRARMNIPTSPKVASRRSCSISIGRSRGRFQKRSSLAATMARPTLCLIVNPTFESC